MDEIVNISNPADIDDDTSDVQFERKNPFIDRLKDGYSIVIQCPPGGKHELYTYEEIIDDEIKKFKIVILDKIKDLPREQVDDRLDELFEALKNF